MYESKYKHKHAERRAMLFPEKVVHKEPTALELQSDQLDRALQHQPYSYNAARQQQLASLSQQQQAFHPQQQQNAFGGLAGLLGGAALFGR